MSTACGPARWSGVTRPICQSQRMGWPVRSRCGGYQQDPPPGLVQASGAGSGTTRQRKDSIVAPATSAVCTSTRCLPTASLPVGKTLLRGIARHGPPSTR